MVAAPPLRIGIDASNLRGGGGAVTHLAGILESGDPREQGIGEVTVWSGSQTLAALPEQDWLRKVDQPLLNRSVAHRLYWRRHHLRRLARDCCDVIFSPGGGLGASSRPVVTMFRNMLPFDVRERTRYGWSAVGVRLRLLRYAQMRAFKNAAGVIFLNENAKATVIAACNGQLRGLTAVIPHGIDDAFRSMPRFQRPLSEYSKTNPFRFLYVSIVDLYKHQWSVARAVAKLRGEGLPVALDLYGPAYPPALRRLEAALQEVDPTHEFIRYHGSAKTVELPALYKAADAFVFASTCENMPNIMIEAMASGLPIASANRSPMPDVVGIDAAEFFDPENPSCIAAALRRLSLDARLRQTIAQKSFDRAQQYSWRRCARDTFNFLIAAGAKGDTSNHAPFCERLLVGMSS